MQAHDQQNKPCWLIIINNSYYHNLHISNTLIILAELEKVKKEKESAENELQKALADIEDM